MRRRNWLLLFLLLLLIVIIGIVVFVMLVVKVRRIDIQPVDYHVQTDQTDFGKWGFQAPVAIDFIGVNENYFDITLLDTKIRATHPLYNGWLGQGTVPKVVLTKRTDRIPFVGTILIRYTFDEDPDKRYMSALVTNCTKGVSNGVYLDITMDAKYDTFIRDGERHEERSVIIPCEKITNALNINF